MVKLHGPMHSISASGSFAKTLVYSSNQSGPIGRFRAMPAPHRSQRQRAYRTAMRMLASSWANISEANQDTWSDRPLAVTLSRYHAYFTYNLNRLKYCWPFTQTYPTSGGGQGATYDPPTIDAVNGHVIISLPITDPKNAWGFYTWRHTSSSVPMNLDHCLELQPLDHIGTYSILDQPPAPDHYWYKMRAFKERSEWMTPFPLLDIEV